MHLAILHEPGLPGLVLAPSIIVVVCLRTLKILADDFPTIQILHLRDVAHHQPHHPR